MNPPERTLSLACELIARPSITPQDEGCQALLMERLQAIGFRCSELPFGDTQNFWAEWGEDGPLLAFAGHTDVVPPGPREQWSTDPFEPTLRDGLLFGRGAADMKGSLAAMVIACEDFLAGAAPKNGRIGFLITSDEEGPATDGTVRVMQWLKERGTHLDYCVVGEPSSSETLGDTIKNGRRGSLNGALRLLGRQGHVAYPQHADNPIHRALPALLSLTTRRWDEGNQYFPPSSFQITNVSAGTGVSNVIPGEMTMLLNFRFSTEQTAATLKDAVAAVLEQNAIKYSIDWQLSGEPFITREGALIDAAREAVAAETAQNPLLSTSGGTSDGRFIAPYGTELVELGPINASIHRADEHVRIDDLPRLARIYQGIIERLLGAGAA
ncbi:MAG: succinyl-diaminopimelate desuccinylase [Halieaceae bacterium]|jgi:succinyl-diaminopimelate desuccinylase